MLAEEQSALRRVATLVASAPEPEAVFQAVAEEAGRLLHARSAATIRYEGGQALTVGRWATTTTSAASIVGTRGPAGRQRRADRDRRAHRRARADRGLRRGPRARGRVDARARLPLARSRRRSWPAGGSGGSCSSASAGALGADAEHRLAGFAELVALALESAEARAELNASRRADPRGGRDRAPAAGAQPARRRAAAAGRARRAAAGAREAPRRSATRRSRCCAARRYELEQALAELRELARGLHPAVLADRGLAPALETLASRAPLPVTRRGRARRSASPSRWRPRSTSSSPRA